MKWGLADRNFVLLCSNDQKEWGRNLWIKSCMCVQMCLFPYRWNWQSSTWPSSWPRMWSKWCSTCLHEVSYSWRRNINYCSQYYERSGRFPFSWRFSNNFHEYICNSLLPVLQPFNGSSKRLIVTMASASIPHVDEVCGLIPLLGALVWLLFPHYSHGLNPTLRNAFIELNHKE